MPEYTQNLRNMSEYTRELPNIPEFYRGRSIFITGGSGFMGKVLIEKLLRSCPELDTVYLLLRDKKNKMAAERVRDITDLALFDRIRRESPALLTKLVAVSGDVTELGLGLSPADRCKLQEQVSVVFHAAASVRFDDPIRNAVLVNVRGTREVLELALGMKKLQVLLHLSTAYCNFDKPEVEERIYAAPGDWRTMIEMAERPEDDHLLRCLTPKIVGMLPNTYTYAKALSEHVVHDYSHRLPLVIVRPSIVVSAVEEPVPGWLDNLNGPFGLCVAVGKGIVVSTLADKECKGDWVPVDIAIKSMIFIAMHRAVARDVATLPVYNCCTMTRPCSYGGLIDYGLQYNVTTLPFENVLWYPRVTVTQSPTMHYIRVLIFHLLPALLVDAVLKLRGKKQMLVKLQRRIYIANSVLAIFARTETKFVNEKFRRIGSEMQESDLLDFDYNAAFPEELPYFKTTVEGIRTFVLKESESSIATSLAHINRLYWLHHTTRTLFFLLVIWAMSTWSLTRSSLHALQDYFDWIILTDVTATPI